MNRADEFWSIHQLAAATGGNWPNHESPPPNTPIAGVSIDSRTIANGEAFIAIRGERFDGHDFITAAVQRGAAMIIADNPSHHQVRSTRNQAPTLIVRDTRRALGAMASTYRERLDAIVIAVTGSNGKTSTVRLLDAAFRHAGWATASPIKSFNNDIGVPLTILAAPPATRALICEVGMNNPGEIAALASIVRPDAAVITSIGRAHVGRLGSVPAIAREKLSLLRFLRTDRAGPPPLALVPAYGTDPAAIELALDELLEDHPERSAIDLRRITAGHMPGIRWRVIDDPAASTQGVSFTIEDDHADPSPRSFRVPFPGDVMAANGALAVTVARWAGIDDTTIARSLLNAKPAEHRMAIRTATLPTGQMLRVLDDCYNASPESMLAALHELRQTASSLDARSLLILGAMGELGDHSESAHREIGRHIAERWNHQDRAVLIAVGEEARWIVEEARSTIQTAACVPEPGPELDRLVERTLRSLAAQPGPIVALVKGSRGIALESIVPRLIGP